MVLQILSPRVQNGQDTDLGAEVLGIGGDLQQGFRGGLEENSVDHPRILQGDGTDCFREREDHVKVLDGQQLRCSRIQPSGRSRSLALGTMTVATRVVSDPLVSALIACLDVPAQCRSAAANQIIEDTTLLGRKRISKLVDERGPTAPDHIGHFGPMFAHDI
jgi:hypothetical protein